MKILSAALDPYGEWTNLKSFAAFRTKIGVWWLGIELNNMIENASFAFVFRLW